MGVLFYVFSRLVEFRFTVVFLVVNSLDFNFTGPYRTAYNVVVFLNFLISQTSEFSRILILHGTHASKFKYCEYVPLLSYVHFPPKMADNMATIGKD